MVPRGGIRVEPATVLDRVKQRKRLDEVQREIEEISRKIENERSLFEIVKLRKLFEQKDEEREQLYKATIHQGTKMNASPVNLNAVNLDAVNLDSKGVNLDAVNLDLDEVNSNEVMTLRQRRNRNRETQKRRKEEREQVQKLLNLEPVKVNMPKLTMKDRKAINAARLAKLDDLAIRNGFGKAIKFAEDWRTKDARDKAAEDDAEAERLVKKMATQWENPEVKKERKKKSVMESKQHLFHLKQMQEGNAPNELKEMMVKTKTKPKPRKRFGWF
jgi:hypothetical protein